MLAWLGDDEGEQCFVGDYVCNFSFPQCLPTPCCIINAEGQRTLRSRRGHAMVRGRGFAARTYYHTVESCRLLSFRFICFVSHDQIPASDSYAIVLSAPAAASRLPRALSFAHPHGPSSFALAALSRTSAVRQNQIHLLRHECRRH